MFKRHLRKVFGALGALSFFALLGTVGGSDNGKLDFKTAILLSVLFCAAFAIFVYLAGAFEPAGETYKTEYTHAGAPLPKYPLYYIDNLGIKNFVLEKTRGVWHTYATDNFLTNSYIVREIPPEETKERAQKLLAHHAAKHNWRPFYI